MKKIVIVFLLASSYPGFTQVPKINTSICQPCAVLLATSISQVADVKKTDTYYIALSSLIEKYGIDLAPCDNKNLGGSLTLTTAMVIPMLNSALDRMNEIINEALAPIKDDKRAEIYSSLMPHQFDMYKHFFTSASQIVDLKEIDCYYIHAQSLIEQYSIDITNKEGLLEVDKPANGKTMAILLKDAFGIKNFNTEKYNSAVITKGTFIIMLHAALEEYDKKITAATK
jgi:hypothetical protein